MTDDQLMAEYQRTVAPDLFAEIYRRNLDRTRAYVNRFLAGKYAHLIEDAVQDVFLRVHNYRNGYTAAAEPTFLSWFYKLCQNVTFKILKRERRYAREVSSNKAVATDSSAINVDADRAEATNSTIEMLEQLSPEKRDLVRAAYLEGKSLQDVSDELGINYHTLWSRLRNTLGEMRERATA